MSNSVTAFRYRWFVENCSQLELPNGKVIVIDPIFRKDKAACLNQREFGYVSGFDDTVIEKCDYILLTHVHFDHIGSLRELQDRFQAPILVNGWSAYELIKHLNLPTGSVIPMSDGCEYNFDDFRVLWQQARHTAGIGKIRPRDDDPRTSDMTAEEREFLYLGTVYHSAFIIKMNNGMSVAMDAGNFEPHLVELEKHRPTLVLMHASRDWDEMVDLCEKELNRSGAPYVFLETLHIVKDAKEAIDYINAKLAERGVYGRVVYAASGQWINFRMEAALE